MKKIIGQIKLQVPAGKANPSPPIGPALGQHGVNIMEFCKAFNARTQAQAAEAMLIPVVITVFADRWPLTPAIRDRLANRVLQMVDELLSGGHCRADALHLKGQALRAMERYEEAIEQFSAALEINPGYAKARQNLEKSLNDKSNKTLP